MKYSTCGLLVLVTMYCTIAISTEREKLSKDALDAFVHGAKIKETIRVGDSTGRPVAEAVVKVGYEQGSTGKVKVYTGVTDLNGSWTVEGYCSRFANYRITREGYYETYVERSMFSSDYAEVNRRISDGSWQPWNAMVKVVLKEKRKPIPMVSHAYIASMPVTGVPLGYDFEKGDWIPPHGAGMMADAEIEYSRVVSTNAIRRYTSTLSIRFPNQSDGCYIVRKDLFSKFDKPYEAETPKERCVVFILDGTDEKILTDDRLGADEVLVFRIRTEVDDKGEIVRCYHGYIDGALKFAQGPKKELWLKSVLNTNNLDRNLEWDGKDTVIKR